MLYTEDLCKNIYSTGGQGTDYFYQDADGIKLVMCGAVSVNSHGSYLTMMSSNGLMFSIINIVGNFGIVLVLTPQPAFEI